MATNIGPLVRKYRERHRMTQQDLVEYTGLERSASYFSSIETGRTSPTLAEMEAMARVFRTPLLDFIAEAGNASGRAPRADEGEGDRALALLESLSEPGRAMALELLELLAERERGQQGRTEGRRDGETG